MSLSASATSRRATARAVLAMALVLSAWRFYRIRNYAEFVDESVEMTTGWLVSEGETLYRTVFSHHMPLAVAISQAVAAVSPTDRPAHFRVAPWAAHVLLALALAFGPLGRRRPVAGPLAAAALLLLISVLAPLLMAQMVLNDVFWGVAFSIAFVLVPLPLLLGERPGARDALAAGAASALAVAGSPMALVPLALSAGIAALASSRRTILPTAGFVLAGILGAFACIGLWALGFADAAGFRREVLEFNADVYTRFAGPGESPGVVFAETLRGWRLLLFGAVPDAVRGDIDALLVPATVAVPICLAAVFLRRARGWSGVAESIRAATIVALLLVIFFSLRIRGAGFHALPLHLAVLAAAAVLLTSLGSGSARVAAVAIALTFAPAVGRALRHDSFAFGAADRQAAAGALSDAARYVAVHTAPDERIAAFPTLAIVYLEAKRRPVTDSVFFLPWQAMWEERSPSVVSTCSQLRAHPPSYVVLQETTVWRTFPWESYALCIDQFLKASYEKVDRPELHGLVLRRKDLPHNVGLAVNREP